MSSVDEIKRAFRPVFTRDLRQVEPTKSGLIVGDNLRVYVEKDGPVLRFLKGTDRATRKSLTDKLDAGKITYTIGQDFES